MADYVSSIRSVLAKYGRLATDVDQLADTDDLYTVGLTSHTAVNVMMALEDEYDMEFAEHLLERRTFESIANLTAALTELVG